MTEQEQIDALKAQVNCLRQDLKEAVKYLKVHGYTPIANSMLDTLNATSEQCLAEVKAKAIEGAIAEVTKQGSGMQINVTPYFYDYRVLKFINELKEHAQQLREHAK